MRHAYTATAPGEFPPGVYWTAGETREVEHPVGADVPAWLEPVAADKPARPAAKGKG